MIAEGKSLLDAATLAGIVGVLLLGGGAAARSQEATDPAPKAADDTKVTFTGYLETFYSYNLNRPGNNVTAFRGFDNRSDTFTVSNAVLDAAWASKNVSGHLVLQVGHTPETYYLAEPSFPAVGGVGKSTMDVWKYIQQATLGWKTGIGRGLQLEGGVFLSPIGPEGMAVKDNWNWSRSDLFYGLPFYHTGVRANYSASDRLTLTAAVYNGWNDVTDNNRNKSVSVQALYSVTDKLTASALYFGGVERSTGAPEGEPWRNLFDGHVTLSVTPRFSAQLHLDGGFENNTFGRSDWFATAAAARIQARPWLYLAARGDVFWENAASNELGTASAIFWPADRVSSATFTVDARPTEKLSIRLEYRHDSASGPMFFGDDPETPDRDSQDTVTLGMVAWF